jgi:tetratricopeptide (TPR) repeat protein
MPDCGYAARRSIVQDAFAALRTVHANEEYYMRKAILGLAALLIFAAPALAAGSDGSSTSTDPSTKCKRGEVWSKKKKKCVPASSGILPDEELYEQGRLLAKGGHYDWALAVFAAVQNQNDPRVLNYIGYSNRKAGRLDAGISYYRKALAIDPDFVLAREYLGEGYVAAGKIDLAKNELAEIGKRCGTTCEEYLDLAAEIAKAKN